MIFWQNEAKFNNLFNSVLFLAKRTGHLIVQNSLQFCKKSFGFFSIESFYLLLQNTKSNSLNRRPQIDGSQRQLNFESSLNLKPQLHCQQRMAAQLEEVVVHTDLLQVENLTPDAMPALPRSGSEGQHMNR